jgi:uncharacterized protein (DUF305 family)
MHRLAVRPTLTALTLAAALALAGCGGAEAGGMEDMGHSSSAPSSAAAPASTPTGTTPTPTPAVGPHSDADVMFAQAMVPHHEQGVEMSDLLLAKSDAAPEVRALAEQIRAAQAPEITQMTGWLEGWGFQVMPMNDHMDHSGHAGSGMDGMLSAADLEELERAGGADASRLFLEGMVEHHEGAVAMARTAIAEGENRAVIDLATSIVATQQQEMTVMEDLLTRL